MKDKAQQVADSCLVSKHYVIDDTALLCKECHDVIVNILASEDGYEYA